MIRVAAYFTEAHKGSALEIQKILAADWPTTRVVFVEDVENDDSNIVELDGEHAKTCTDCQVLLGVV